MSSDFELCMLWILDYYDYPLSGIALYNNEKVYFKIKQESMDLFILTNDTIEDVDGIVDMTWQTFVDDYATKLISTGLPKELIEYVNDNIIAKTIENKDFGTWNLDYNPEDGILMISAYNVYELYRMPPNIIKQTEFKHIFGQKCGFYHWNTGSTYKEYIKHTDKMITLTECNKQNPICYDTKTFSYIRDVLGKDFKRKNISNTIELIDANIGSSLEYVSVCKSQEDSIKLCSLIRKYLRRHKNEDKLKCIELLNNNLGKYIKLFAPYLKYNNINTLVLTHNNIGKNIKSLVPYLSRIHTLDLGSNNLGKYIKCLKSVLKYSKSLNTLDITNNGIGEHIKDIYKYITYNKYLEKLYLIKNGLTNYIRYVLHILKHNTMLKTLDITDNMFDCKEIILCLKSNKSLVRLIAGSSNNTIKSYAEEVLKYNSTLCSILFYPYSEMDIDILKRNRHNIQQKNITLLGLINN